MAKLRDDYDETPGNNTDAPPIGAPEEHAPSAVNDISRRVMASIAELGDEFDILIDRATLEPGYTVPEKLEDMARQVSSAVAITGGTLEGVTIAGDGAGLLNVDAATLQGLAASAFAQLDQPTTFLNALTVTGLFTALAGAAVTGDGSITGNGLIGGTLRVVDTLTVEQDVRVLNQIDVGSAAIGGDSIIRYWDDDAVTWRNIKWSNVSSEFQVEDAGTVNRTIIHSGNIDEFGGDDTLGGIPAADYMRKDIDQTMVGALFANGLLTINSLANAGDIQWDIAGAKGSLKIGTLLIAFGLETNINTLTYGVTFSALPMAIVATPIRDNNIENATIHVRVAGVSSATMHVNDASQYYFLVIGAA